MKDEIMLDIKSLIEGRASVSRVEGYTNLEGDYVVSYEQNGTKYLITIEEV